MRSRVIELIKYEKQGWKKKPAKNRVKYTWQTVWLQTLRQSTKFISRKVEAYWKYNKNQKLKLKKISTKYGILEGKGESDSLQKVFLFGRKCYSCWLVLHVDGEICLNIKQMFNINVT